MLSIKIKLRYMCQFACKKAASKFVSSIAVHLKVKKSSKLNFKIDLILRERELKEKEKKCLK